MDYEYSDEDNGEDYSSHTFVLSWDQLGLEAVVNATDIEQNEVFDILRDAPATKSRPRQLEAILSAMTMRARANGHRHYEIYAVEVDKSITEEQIRKYFEDDPQAMADLIRRRGRKLYSDRQPSGIVIK